MPELHLPPASAASSRSKKQRSSLHCGHFSGGLFAYSNMWQPLQFEYLQEGHRSDSVIYPHFLHCQLYMVNLLKNIFFQAIYT
jgi:hypothetical protein